MSCATYERVDFGRLREESPEAEALRDELRPHLRSCAACRGRAIAHDPTLAFTLLPGATSSAAEVLEMQQRVAGARRLLEQEGGPPQRSIAWRGLAGRAAAALLLPALALAGIFVARERADLPPRAALALVGDAAPSSAPGDAALAARLDGLPLVDHGERDAPDIVYQVEGASFDLVLLVDAGLELGGP